MASKISIIRIRSGSCVSCVTIYLTALNMTADVISCIQVHLCVWLHRRQNSQALNETSRDLQNYYDFKSDFINKLHTLIVYVSVF
jgi:hypothetical protein